MSAETDNGGKPGIRLQVLIATMGEGIRRVAEASHPRIDGVEYLVGWQRPDGTTLPEELERDDFRILPHGSIGLSRNRNFLFDNATAPLLLISDDDISYTTEGLRAVVDAFEERPDADMLTFRYSTTRFAKHYPDVGEFSLSKIPKGYFLTSFELAIRREALLRAGLRFDERFGLGSGCYLCGEEEVFLYSALRAGLRGSHVPVEVCEHPPVATTGDRTDLLPQRVESVGAVVRWLHPFSWPLRMAVHAWRNRREISPLNYCRAFIGRKKADIKTL